nr:MAG TPA: hypothetical protein [Caudoviricetes sp.]
MNLFDSFRLRLPFVCVIIVMPNGKRKEWFSRPNF